MNTAAVITISDKGARGERKDTSGPALCEALKKDGFQVVYTNIIPDEKELIMAELIKCSDELGIRLVLTTGGTGFSKRDITPEATLAVIERATPGLPEQMRAESMKITPRGSLSRAVAGIRGETLIVNLPGSERAAKENYAAISPALEHGVAMLASAGSADCGNDHHHHHHDHKEKKQVPSMDAWLKEAKESTQASRCGMFLTHNGTVRETARAFVRNGETDAQAVCGMEFSSDAEKVQEVIEETYKMPGIYYIKVWLNEGMLQVGDDIMYVMIGGDIRPHVVDALHFLVGKIKNECVIEKEQYK